MTQQVAVLRHAAATVVATAQVLVIQLLGGVVLVLRRRLRLGCFEVVALRRGVIVLQVNVQVLVRVLRGLSVVKSCCVHLNDVLAASC